MSNTKNLIFDLGNVLYDIDFVKMYDAFDQLGVPNFENHFTLNKSDQIFFDLEKGLINETEFCKGFNTLYNLNLTHQQIMDAWNALLVGYRKESIDWVKAHNGQYATFLYSNTNQILSGRYRMRNRSAQDRGRKCTKAPASMERDHPLTVDEILNLYSNGI